MRKQLAFLLLLILSLVQANHPLWACPFSSYKKGQYSKKHLTECLPKVDSKEILSKFSKRYEIALHQLQYNYPYDLIQTQEQIAQLEKYSGECDSHSERKALKKTARSLKLISDPKCREQLVAKDRYKHFIDMLREAIELKESAHWGTNEIKDYLENVLSSICYSHFTININHTSIGYSYFWELMPKELAHLEPSQLNAKLINKTINKIFPVSAPSVLFSKLNRKMHSPFFAYWDGSMATIRSKLANYQWEDRHVSLLRMSCPVYGKNYRPRIDPIFTQFLDSMKKKNQKLLYINNLDTTSSAYSREFKISKLLSDLSNNEAYKDTFLFIILPFDSPFYRQGNLGLLRASYFKETFLNSMLLKQEGFYFPSSLLTSSSFITFLDKLIEEIHRAYFDDSEFLERIERCQFIDIAYAHIAKYLIEQHNIDMVNWTCRHSVDRAMSAVAVFDVLLQSISKTPPHLDSTIYISTWPAMLNYHRHPNTTTTVRSYSAIQKLLERKAELELPRADPSEVQDLALY